MYRNVGEGKAKLNCKFFMEGAVKAPSFPLLKNKINKNVRDVSTVEKYLSATKRFLLTNWKLYGNL